jgi:hypothetical protein
MHNQHAGLSQELAEQHISQRRERAAHARLAHSARLPRRRRPHGWSVAGGSRLAGQPCTDQPVSRPQGSS